MSIEELLKDVHNSYCISAFINHRSKKVALVISPDLEDREEVNVILNRVDKNRLYPLIGAISFLDVEFKQLDNGLGTIPQCKEMIKKYYKGFDALGYSYFYAGEMNLIDDEFKINWK